MRASGGAAQFVTSRSAGPFLLTVDVVFSDEATSRTFTSLRALDRHVIAGLYGIPEGDILKIIEFDPACAVTATMSRPMGSRALGETDVYGARSVASTNGMWRGAGRRGTGRVLGNGGNITGALGHRRVGPPCCR